eukprot:1161913-Pelagomonas_calceolata.AAC.7
MQTALEMFQCHLRGMQAALDMFHLGLDGPFSWNCGRRGVKIDEVSAKFLGLLEFSGHNLDDAGVSLVCLCCNPCRKFGGRCFHMCVAVRGRETIVWCGNEVNWLPS